MFFRGDTNCYDNSKFLAYVAVMKSELLKSGVKIYTSTKALEIVTDYSGKVTDVRALGRDGTMQYFGAKTVILGIGGNGYNKEMTMRYNPEAFTYIDIGGPRNMGDGITMAFPLNAGFVGLGPKSMLLPSGINAGIIGTHYASLTNAFSAWDREAPRAFIYVDSSAERYIDDTAGYEVWGQLLRKHPEYSPSYQISNQSLYLGPEYTAAALAPKKTVDDLINQGIIQKADTVADLAGMLGLDSNALQSTIDTYNSYVKNGKTMTSGGQQALLRR